MVICGAILVENGDLWCDFGRRWCSLVRCWSKMMFCGAMLVENGDLWCDFARKFDVLEAQVIGDFANNIPLFELSCGGQ